VILQAAAGRLTTSRIYPTCAFSTSVAGVRELLLHFISFADIGHIGLESNTTSPRSVNERDSDVSMVGIYLHSRPRRRVQEKHRKSLYPVLGLLCMAGNLVLYVFFSAANFAQQYAWALNGPNPALRSPPYAALKASLAHKTRSGNVIFSKTENGVIRLIYFRARQFQPSNSYNSSVP
jgi:hypothetical protein